MKYYGHHEISDHVAFAMYVARFINSYLQNIKLSSRALFLRLLSGDVGKQTIIL